MDNNYQDFKACNINTYSEAEYRKIFISKLDTDLAEYIPNFYEYLSKVSLDIIIWFLKTPLQKSWRNHLVLALVALTWAGSINVYTPIRMVHQFLDWVIPSQYPDLDHLLVREGLENAYASKSRGISTQWDKNYHALQTHVNNFLNTIPYYDRNELTQFTLPILTRNEKLRKARLKNEKDAENDRKELVWCLLPKINNLVQLAIQRFIWVKKLSLQIDEVKKRFLSGEIILPIEISMTNFDGIDHMQFKIWNLSSWESTHQINTKLGKECRDQSLFFVELISKIPENDWFLKGVEVGLIHNGKVSDVKGSDYYTNLNISSRTFWDNIYPGLLSPTKPLQQCLSSIKRPRGTPLLKENSSYPVLFDVDSILAASSIGILSMFTMLNTTMRMGELQQISWEDEVIQTQDLGYVDDIENKVNNGNIHRVLLLFPKALLERHPYRINNFVYKLMIDWCQIHKKLLGYEIMEVEAANMREFRQAWKYEGKHRFIFQWNKLHLSDSQINACITFLTLNHKVPDPQGKQLRITSHLFRHCASTILRSQGVSIDELMEIMVHVNIDTTLYYSKPSEVEVYKHIQPILNNLGEKAEEDPNGIRGVEDFVSFLFRSLRKFGCLQTIQGGFCGSYRICKVKHHCASCAYFEIDPNRINEVIGLENCLEESAKILDDEKQVLLAKIQRQHAHDWHQLRLQAKEMKALSEYLPTITLPQELDAESVSRKTLLNEIVDPIMENIEKGII